jgi:pimeloyl-ACP methyl ester carboxylesterase
MRRHISLLAALLPLVGCVSLRPFSEVRASLPAESFLRLGDQLVHVEQAGRGEPVVLIHGFGASTYAWRKVMPGLAASFHVIALDLNGFGYTERPRTFEPYTREGQAALILGVLDALGIEKAHFIGHSYGGGLTLYLAARHPERLRSMVLLDSTSPNYAAYRRNRAASLKPLTGLFLRTVALRPGSVRRGLQRSFYDDSLITPEMVREYYDRLRIEGASNAYYGLTAPTPTRPEVVVLDAVQVPALVIYGAEDKLITPESGRKAANHLPHFEFVVMERTGHVPMEERPEELLRIVLPFLERQRG